MSPDDSLLHYPQIAKFPPVMAIAKYNRKVENFNALGFYWLNMFA